MNDVMSMGIHRLWKRYTIELAGVGKGDRVLDLAGGTGDLAARFAAKEAVSKAFGTGIGPISWREIEVVIDDAGRLQGVVQPLDVLDRLGEVESISQRLDGAGAALTVHHPGEVAAAVAVTYRSVRP